MKIQCKKHQVFHDAAERCLDCVAAAPEPSRVLRYPITKEDLVALTDLLHKHRDQDLETTPCCLEFRHAEYLADDPEWLCQWCGYPGL